MRLEIEQNSNNLPHLGVKKRILPVDYFPNGDNELEVGLPLPIYQDTK